MFLPEQTKRPLLWLPAVLLPLYIAWQLPGLYRGAITAAEADAYLSTLAARPLPPAARDELLLSARRFMADDDGQPVYMLNLMRYHPTLQRAADSPAFDGTPREANARYESLAMPLLFRHGGQPLYGGEASGDNLLTQDAALNHWSRVLVIRYPSRRAFMDLVTDPAYAPIVPYKLMALQVVLTPTASEVVLPLLWPVALVLWLLTLWGLWRGARRGGAA